MYAIETDLGRFEGDTEKEAKAAMRKARKIAQAKERELEELRKTARMRAEAVAYGFYERLHSNGQLSWPRGWRLITASENCWSCRKVWDDNAHQTVWHMETEHGKAVCDVYDGVSHAIENGAGYCIAVAIPKQDAELFAVGVCGEVGCWVPMPGIRAEWFREADRGDCT